MGKSHAAVGESAAAVSGALISGRYRLLAELGRGGMAVVHRARDEATGALIAIKRLESQDARGRRLFEREYHTLASLKHPRVIEVHDFGIAPDGQPFYTMELIEGADLLELAPLPYVRACALVHDVATCLALLHARRLLHRDVSPGNVRLDACGRAKLLDFGALGDFGLPREVVGTPAYMPVETVQGLPLDQRSDLFALGATLYFALTGRPAFEVQRFEDIELVQRTPALPPSAYIRDIPQALDQLVLSLLDRDPQRRPSSAAELLDRLAAIAGLDAEPLAQVAESHLLSSAFVGRTRELTQLSELAQRAQRGEGSVALLVAASGMGRSRLASELSILARISGMMTVRVDARAQPEPTRTLATLGRTLLELAPLEAAATLASHARVLGQVYEELRVAGPETPLPRDRAERSLLIQRAFAAWIIALSEIRPLVVVVDDVHALDSEAAGLCALLAYSASHAPLLLLVTQERDAPVPSPIQLLARVAVRVELEPLERESIEALVSSVFGDVPHRARLTEWLIIAGQRNPGHSLELLKLLVDRGLTRYVGGAWVLPAFLPEHELPNGVEAALHARLQALSPEARRLVRLFALHHTALPLQVCLQLAREPPASRRVAQQDQMAGSEHAPRAAAIRPRSPTAPERVAQEDRLVGSEHAPRATDAHGRAPIAPERVAQQDQMAGSEHAPRAADAQGRAPIAPERVAQQDQMVGGEHAPRATDAHGRAPIAPERVAQQEPMAGSGLSPRVDDTSRFAQTAPELVAQLDRLVGSELLLRAHGSYRFARDALRESALRDASAQERQALHGALAQAFLQARPELLGSLSTLGTQDLCLLLAVAGHLVHASDTRGPVLQREVAIELTMRGAGLVEAAPQLEAAAAELAAQGRPAYERAALLVPLCLAGAYCDYRLSYRYGLETLDMLLDLTGLGFAARLRPWLGGRAALMVGLAAGFVRFHLTRRARIARSFRDAMLGVMGIGTALLGTFSVLVDKVHAQRVVTRLEILRHFPARHPVRCVHALQQALYDVTRGEIARACERALETFRALATQPSLREEARLQLQVGCLTPVTLAYSLRVDGKAHEVFEQLDRMPTSVSRQVVAGGRAVYHGHRGEHAQHTMYREQMDLLASQAGSTWREDVGTPRQMWNTYLLCEDVLGLKRAASDLDALAELPSIRKLRDVTRACYLCERGQAREALELYRELFEAARQETGLQALRIAGAYARILRHAGEPAHAREVCSDALARISAEDRVFAVATFTAELELALCTAAVGDIDEAIAQLDAIVRAQLEHDNPLLRGLAHKGRALVAIQQRDRQTFEHHLSDMEAWFKRTGNPALIAQCQRLAEQAQRAGVLSPRRAASGTHAIASNDRDVPESDNGPVTVRGRPTR